MSDKEEDTVTIDGRVYPSRYPPGLHWALDEAWSILDALPPETLSLQTRSYLAGAIWGALTKLQARSKDPPK